MKNKIKKPEYNLFDKVWFIRQEWSSKKQKCGFCGGEGEIGIEPVDHSLSSEVISCPKCDGEGLFIAPFRLEHFHPDGPALTKNFGTKI